jgi:hypothetical protein
MNNMKKQIVITVVLIISASCNSPIVNNQTNSSKLQLEGTWKLLTGTLIEKGDTTVTDYTRGKEFIKIINGSHFAFLNHDLSKGKNADSTFSAGGGPYTLNDSLYTEHLAYCNDRQWEGNDFTFTVSINNDTLVQKGVEKVDSLGVNRMNIEKYVRIQTGQ